MSDQILITTKAPIKIVRAAEYVRMSTHQQQFSIAYQQAAIRLYAAQRGITVVQTYADEGRSGLTLSERPAMIRLLSDVESGNADFQIILVYDVSRWGRFQDTDEGAYHEFRCRQVGKHIEYCAEQFPNQLGPIAAVMKAIKRAMAAEYSRELAVKTGAAQARATAQGFLQGGIAGYGLRRMLIDADGKEKGVIRKGEHKYYRTDRIVLAPGPKEEIAVVRRIFDLYVSHHVFKDRIARILNSEGVPPPGPRATAWSGEHIRHILQNERFIGHVLYDRTTSKLRLGQSATGRVKNPPSLWVRGRTGMPPIISPEIFAAANAPKSKPGAWYRDDDALLAPLRTLWSQHGYITHALIEGTPGLPSPQTYRKRFGTIENVYRRLGYNLRPYDAGAKHYRASKVTISAIVKQTVLKALRCGVSSTWHPKTRVLSFASGYDVKFSVARSVPTRDGPPKLVFHVTRPSAAHSLLVIELDPTTERPRRCFFLPLALLPKGHTYFDRRTVLDDFQCNTIASGLAAILANAKKKSAASTKTYRKRGTKVA